MEEREIRKTMEELNITKQINIYPGADEVGLTMLSKSMTDLLRCTPNISLFYRDPAYKDRIPNYEGQPLNQSIIDQIRAAGGNIVGDDVYDINST